jgi:phage host-nuclease inhibitor protein Gam
MSTTVKNKTKTRKLDRVQALEAMAEYAAATASLEAIESQKRLEVLEIETRYREDLEAYKQQLDASYALLKQYADENPEMFEDAKSVKMGVGQFGFRVGPEKLDLLPDWDWDKVGNTVDSKLKRVKVEVDKKALLALAKTNAEKAAAYGVQVVRDEAFFVKI